MLDPLKIPIRATTQEHLEIEDILEDVVLLKDGSATVLLSVTALNFDLLSEREQDAMIYAYAALLNSLTYAVQITIRSRRTDISTYLQTIDIALDKQTSPEIKNQIAKYREFIQSLVKENNVLDKRFYVSIPFSSLELGVTKSAISGAISKKNRSLPYPKSYILERAKMALYPKRDHLIRQFSRIGLKVYQLTTQELVQIFYDWYNPESYGTFLASKADYSTAIVQPAIAGSKIKVDLKKNHA
ncbi:MAG: hypothetical protein UW69_C0089G0002 [Microgenomates group bacterium GW2011_GWA2_44_7]|nr:MAG: hypothetical protein UW69_C0089G0002 [Microgenomates group bacterium GW2011_GWA2_44_7]KKT77986.1 MAG: hypothetical protein UW73_C0009G0085 [Microgenomates group bacterium GW2011_GWB1_44_8]